VFKLFRHSFLPLFHRVAKHGQTV